MAGIVPYRREAAVQYAHQWAYGRNPAFYDYEELGGDCTNFVSQCLYEACGIMNFAALNGWYYWNSNQKSPSWTGVPFFYEFLTRREETPGPMGRLCNLAELRRGDVIQFSSNREGEYHHSLLVVSRKTPATLENIEVAAHSYDVDHRELADYRYEKIRFLHIEGIRMPI